MSQFDAAYYEKHYFDPATRVSDEESVRRLAGFVCAYADLLEVDIDSVLDLGCGVGLWQGALEKRLHTIEYTGVEISSVMCERFGWTQGSVIDFTPEEPADLVICQGVLQYLNDEQAERALENLAACTGSMLYLEALTKDDWDNTVDQSVTDGDVHLRTGDWYKKRLSKHFILCGGSVFIAKDQGVAMYELERL